MSIDEKRRQKKLAKKAAARKAKAKQIRVAGQVISGGYSSARAAVFPIGDCFIPDFENGIGTVVLTRNLPNGNIALSGFLVDIYCLGVKNAMYQVLSPTDFVAYMNNVQQHAQIEQIHPSCVLKLVAGAVLYAHKLGFAPHPEYFVAAKLFGDIDASVCTRQYTYGKDGKPYYISGPNETFAQSRKIMETLSRTQGTDNFRYLSAIGDTIDDDYDDDDDMITYKVTTSPLPDGPEYVRLPKSVKDIISSIDRNMLNNNPEEVISLLEPLIERYPNIPHMHNYLYVCYTILNDFSKSEQILDKILIRFPDYLFGLTAKAEIYLKRGESDKIPALFNHKFEISLRYPERNLFHISEFLSFNMVMAVYFYTIGNFDSAKKYYDLLHRIDPDAPETKATKKILFPSIPKLLVKKIASFLPSKLFPK